MYQYQYKVYGPFEIPRNDDGYLDFSHQSIRQFWDDIADTEEDLPNACGCYVFHITNKPWYVGLASRQSFRKESLLQKQSAYLEAHNRTNHYGTPSLILIAKHTPTGRFAKPSKNMQKDIALLEELLIGQALRRNPHLINIAKTTLLKRMQVPGVLNTSHGQGNAIAVKSLRKIMGV